MGPGRRDPIFSVFEPTEGPGGLARAIPHGVIVALIGGGNLAIVLIAEAGLRKTILAVVDNRHQSGFVIGNLKRIAARGIARGCGTKSNCLGSIGIGIIDRRNLEAGTALPVEDRDRGRRGRFAHIVARERDDKIPTRIGAHDRGRGRRSPRRLGDRVGGNRDGERRVDRPQFFDPHGIGHHVGVALGAGTKGDHQRAIGHIDRAEGVPIITLVGELTRAVPLIHGDGGEHGRATVLDSKGGRGGVVAVAILVGPGRRDPIFSVFEPTEGPRCLARGPIPYVVIVAIVGVGNLAIVLITEAGLRKTTPRRCR